MASPDTAAPDIAVSPLAGSADDPIVVLGPSLGTRIERLWATVAQSLSGFRVIGWDLPGHGRGATAAQPSSTAESLRRCSPQSTHGADDIVTTAEQNLELVGRTSGSRFEVLPDVGHLAPLEAPEASTTLLQNHFGEG